MSKKIYDGSLIIIPAFNEEDTIFDVVKKASKYCKNILVVNDGSSDDTKNKAKAAGANIISYKTNKGKGFAILLGMRYFLETKYSYLIFLDADGQHNPNDIPRLIHHLTKENDVVIGSRFQSKDWIDNMPFLRKISNLLSRFGILILFNMLKIEDPQNGYRGYTREAIEKIHFIPKHLHKRYGFEVETDLIIRSWVRNLRIKNVSVQSIYLTENKSNFSLLMDTWTIPMLMINRFFKYKSWIYWFSKRR
jgi:glycosyltransferase involved in cell wall biosynthesis